MKTFPRRPIGSNTSSLLLVATITFFSSLISSGLVICVCHDGHITIELQCNPLRCCPEDALGSNDVETAEMTLAASGHACVDLVLDSESLRATRLRSDEAVALSQPEVPGAPLPVRLACRPATTPAFVLPTDDVAPAALSLIGSVVLTI